MAQQLKRWESPRRKGRNRKGRGGSAKQRQYKKRQKLLMKQLKENAEDRTKPKTQRKNANRSSVIKKGVAHGPLLFFAAVFTAKRPDFNALTAAARKIFLPLYSHRPS